MRSRELVRLIGSLCQERADLLSGTLKPVDTAAALASGSTPLPSLPQPRPRALPYLLGSGPSRFEATSRSFKGPPKAADLPPNPRTGMVKAQADAASRRGPQVRVTVRLGLG